MKENPKGSLLVTATLELIVAGIVVLGGVALVYFSVDTLGKTLGIIHATLGLLGLVAGLLLWARRRGAWTLAISSNILIIAFSTGSEAVLSVTASLPSDQFVDSVVGTIAAIVIAVVVTVMLARPEMKSFRRGQD